MRPIKIISYLSCLIAFPWVANCGEKMIQPPDYKLGMKSAAAAAEANSIAQCVKANVRIESRPPTAYATAGKNAALLVIYGIESKESQAKLIDVLALEQKRKGWRSIYIEFRRREVWVVKPNGVRERGDEKILAMRSLLLFQ